MVSTKGKLVAEPDYLSLLSECDCVVQISMACSKYDVLEKGTPSFVERLKMVEARQYSHSAVYDRGV